MKKQSWGRIIFVTSVAAKQPGMLIAHSQRASASPVGWSLLALITRNNKSYNLGPIRICRI